MFSGILFQWIFGLVSGEIILQFLFIFIYLFVKILSFFLSFLILLGLWTCPNISLISVWQIILQNFRVSWNAPLFWKLTRWTWACFSSGRKFSLCRVDSFLKVLGLQENKAHKSCLPSLKGRKLNKCIASTLVLTSHKNFTRGQVSACIW